MHSESQIETASPAPRREVSPGGDGGRPPLVAVVVIGGLGYGGCERQIVELANHVDERQCKLYVCSLADCVPLASALRNPRQLSLILRRSRYDLSVVLRLARFLREVKADVVYNLLFDATIAGRLAARIVGNCAVVDAERNTNYKLKTRHSLFLRLTRWGNDMTIANSRSGAAFQSKLLGQPIESYRVVYNGVDCERFKPRDGSLLRQELGLRDEQPVVGMFASFKPQKNHPLWLRAARRVLDRVPNAKFMFVGDELDKGRGTTQEFKRLVHRTVDELGLRDHCLFLGNHTDVEKYYNICALTVLPSLHEGTPNVALESMASGVPVVVTNVSDNASLILDGRTGYVIPLGDEQILAERVCALLLNDDLRSQMSQQARNWILSNFSCRKFAENTLAVLREAAGWSTPENAGGEQLAF